MTQGTPRLLTVGRVIGHRGRHGELTVRIFMGQAERFTGMPAVWVAAATDPGDGASYRVEADRAYRDRLVLKLAGVDGADAAARLRGCRVAVREDQLTAPVAGEMHPEALVGLEVVDAASGKTIGVVEAVIRTGGVDLLRAVASPAGVPQREVLIPLAAEIVRRIDLDRRRVEIDPPDGLLDLNEG